LIRDRERSDAPTEKKAGGEDQDYDDDDEDGENAYEVVIPVEEDLIGHLDTEQLFETINMDTRSEVIEMEDSNSVLPFFFFLLLLSSSSSSWSFFGRCGGATNPANMSSFAQNLFGFKICLFV